MKIYIKNMVCDRCKMMVQSTLEKVGLHPLSVELGEVNLREKDIIKIKEKIKQELESLGFELLDDSTSKIIAKIKAVIISLIHQKSNNLSSNLSDYLSKELNKDYSFLSKLFSDVEGITIEKYYVVQKIERVKELLVYDELNLSEIAVLLNYSSTAYLSNQFKKVTGLNPSAFKKLSVSKRISLDKL